MGNSEVGHLNLGAGAVVKQDLLRIDEAIEDGSFFENEALRAGRAAAERLHLLGLVSDGGVHSSMDHLRALIELAGREDVPDVVLHAFTDGRDTIPDCGARLRGRGRVAGAARGSPPSAAATTRWTATGAGTARSSPTTRSCRARPSSARRPARRRSAPPTSAARPTSSSSRRSSGEEGRIRDGDAVDLLQLPPRPARAQLTQKLGEAGFRLTTLTEYHEDWDYPVAFPPARPDVTLASTLAERGKAQLHVAETEKYAHVTYFFNGGEEDPYPGEERRLVDSPRDVPTYDKKPEMSARAAARGVRRELARAATSRFGIINFANPDMVGHTGVIEAAVKAVETVDACLGEVVEAVQRVGRRLRDHGRPRQRRPDARARRQPEHGPLDEPGAADRDRRRGRAARGRRPWPTSRPPCSRCWARSSPPR